MTLPPTGLVLLVGANNTGKSALLSALDLVVRGGTPILPRHAASSEPAKLEARFVLSVDEQEQLVGASGLSAADQMVAFQWVEWHFAEAPAGNLQALELHASWPGGRDTVPVAQVVLTSPSSYRAVINPGVLRILGGAPPDETSGVDPSTEVQEIVSGTGVPELVQNLRGGHHRLNLSFNFSPPGGRATTTSAPYAKGPPGPTGCSQPRPLTPRAATCPPS